MSEPMRVQRRRTRGWELPPNTVVVTRPSEWGNPFRVDKATEISPEKGKVTWHVSTETSVWTFPAKDEAQDAAAKLFRANALSEKNEGYRERARLALKGKNLACWCKPGTPCHADVLLQIANHPPAVASGGSRRE